METLKNIALTVVLVVLLWVVVTNTIYRFSNPSVTDVEAFLHLPETVFLDFE